MAGNANTIDLTDEDDPKPKNNAQNSPPALVALNIRNRQQIVTQALQRSQLSATTTTTAARATPVQARMQRQIRKFFADLLLNSNEKAQLVAVIFFQRIFVE